MIIQAVLVVFFLILTAYALLQRGRAPIVAMAMLIISILGTLFTVVPEVATKLAHFVGVGRGADLVLYLFILVSLTAILNLHLRMRANAELVTALARHVALQAVRVPHSGREASQ